MKIKNISRDIFFSALIFHQSDAFAKGCATETYLSKEEWAAVLFFDSKRGIAWDVKADYGIPFNKINYSSGIECIEFEKDTMCGIARDSFTDSHVSIKINGHENIVIGDGSSIETIAYDITRNNNVTRVFSAKTGEMIAFESNVEGRGWTRFFACDLAGAIHLRGLDEQQD